MELDVSIEAWEELIYEVYRLDQEIRGLDREIREFCKGLPDRRNVPIFPDPQTAREYRDLKRLKMERIEDKAQIALDLVRQYDMPVAQGWIDLDGKLLFRLMGSEAHPSVQVEVVNN